MSALFSPAIKFKESGEVWTKTNKTQTNKIYINKTSDNQDIQQTKHQEPRNRQAKHLTRHQKNKILDEQDIRKMSDICWVSIQSSWYYCKITAANSWKTPFRIIFMSWLILSWNHDFTTVNFFLRKRFRISSQPCHHRTVLRQNLHFKNLVTDIKVNCHLKWKSWNVVSFAPTHHRSYVIFFSCDEQLK